MYGNNVYFCAQLLDEPTRRKKENISFCRHVWADLDTCTPDKLEPTPPVVIESSPGRYQAIWPLPQTVPSVVAEEYSKRVAYLYQDEGVDTSGWDLTQLLRVPFTFNYKYPSAPEVQVATINSAKVPLAYFEEMPPAFAGTPTILDTPLPEELDDPDDILAKHRAKLDDRFYPLFNSTPEEDDDWSKLLWRTMQYAFEAGMSREEVFVLTKEAGCNKFKRDEVSPDIYLWADVLRAEAYHNSAFGEGIRHPEAEAERLGRLLPTLTTDEDEKTENTFVQRYTEWASIQTDAPIQYHEVIAFAMLSAIFSGSIRISTSMGRIIPNLWIMLLADTTLTRKTTAMNLGMDLLEDVAMLQDVVLATEGSVEGLMQGLSTRPGKPSIFWKDEITGFMDSVAKKDYLAGMLESLTKLYDGKSLKRTLKKETINVTNPVLIFIGGGIRKKMRSIVNDAHVTSGFIPRFIVVSAENDIETMRPLGRRTEQDEDVRESLKHEIIGMLEKFTNVTAVVTAGGTTMMHHMTEYDLTEEAWERYNGIEKQLVKIGYDSEIPEYLTPVYDRMAKSLLKMAALIAASTVPEGTLPADDYIEVEDINAAAVYIQKWMPYTLELLDNMDKSSDELLLEKLYNYLAKNPGKSRGEVMRGLRLDAYTMGKLQQTLDQRGMIRVVKKGKAVVLWAL